jgi:hypothetical protein
MQEWTKLGLALGPVGTGLLQTHVMVPTPLLLPDRIRVFFTACDADLRGRVFFADLARAFPYSVILVNTQPVLDLGAPGMFDADSVNPGALVEREGRLYLYYIGWQRISEEIPYTLLAGLATSEDNGASFQRLSDRPILPPTGEEKFFRTAPFVWHENGAWQMLYVGGGQFIPTASGKRVPLYALKQTSSADGIVWDRPVTTLREADTGRDEVGFGRPVLWHEGGQRSLMISVRTRTGYTLSQAPYLPADLRTCPLQPVLPAAAEPWDNEMTCFGAPLTVDDREVLFYNGNQFGRTGFGIAWRRAV